MRGGENKETKSDIPRFILSNKVNKNGYFIKNQKLFCPKKINSIVFLTVFV